MGQRFLQELGHPISLQIWNQENLLPQSSRFLSSKLLRLLIGKVSLRPKLDSQEEEKALLFASGLMESKKPLLKKMPKVSLQSLHLSYPKGKEEI